MRTTSETYVTMLNAPIFESQVSQKKTKKKGHEKILEIIVKNFPKIGKEIAIQVQETQRVPNRINPRGNTPRDISLNQQKLNTKSNCKIISFQ